ncbi:MAG: VWA domain-containing protein [Labilithrix sp.]|nr:VWA domain-containing protein [Labilithrix sp.]MCW5815617.1 VWA domain-containing protein [Labilithrix sp.]
MSRSAARRLLLRSAGASLVLVAFASCGARTGLFGPDVDVSIAVDASVDVSIAIDASIDVQVDATPDVSVPDVIEEPTGCVPGTFPFTPATSQIMFVLDRSRSMLYRLDQNVVAEPGVTSRWTALRDALDQTITPFSGEIAMGARFYPVLNASGEAPGACQQDPEGAAIAPALDNAENILRVFRDATPIGGTPTARAIELAARESSGRRSVARAILVATDGAPNCNQDLEPASCTCTAPVTPGNPCNASGPGDGSNCLDDAATVSIIREIAEERNTPVYVVGIGVTGGFASTLDAMAIAGGRPRNAVPRYYPAETPAELRAAFGVVRDSVAKCSYVTPSSPNDPDFITVNVAGFDVPRDPDHEGGWDWIDREFGQLQLFGAACAAATASNVAGTIICDRPDAASNDR